MRLPRSGVYKTVLSTEIEYNIYERNNIYTTVQYTIVDVKAIKSIKKLSGNSRTS